MFGLKQIHKLKIIGEFAKNIKNSALHQSKNGKLRFHFNCFNLLLILNITLRIIIFVKFYFRA